MEMRAVFFLRLISTIAFGVFYSSLALILTSIFSLSNEAAVNITALFFGFHFTLPILGGKLLDIIKNFKQIFILGKLFQLLSSLLLIYATEHHEYLYVGLSLFLIDSMVSTVSLNMLITSYFAQSESEQRRIAFIKGHVWTNMGFILAFLLSGAIYYYTSIEFLLALSALFSLLTMGYCYLFIASQIENSNKNYAKNSLSIISIMMITGALITQALASFAITKEVILILTSIMVGFIFIKSFKGSSVEETHNIAKYLLLMLCSILFWTMYMLSSTFIPIFIKTSVNTEIWGVTLSPQWLQMLCPTLGVLVGIWLSGRLSNALAKPNALFNRINFFIIALVCAALGLLLIQFAVEQQSMGKQLNCGWILGYLAIMSIGELMISPASMALVGDYIPKRYQGIYTGINQLTIGLSVILSGVLAQYILNPINVEHLTQKFSIYMTAAIVILVVCSMLYRFESKLRNC